jgi:hypothetical protein
MSHKTVTLSRQRLKQGHWGIGGHANTNAEVVTAARAQIVELAKNAPAT